MLEMGEIVFLIGQVRSVHHRADIKLWLIAGACEPSILGKPRGQELPDLGC